MGVVVGVIVVFMVSIIVGVLITYVKHKKRCQLEHRKESQRLVKVYKFRLSFRKNYN